MSGLHWQADGRPDRPRTALALLAQAGDKGLTTPEILAAADDGGGSRMSWYGSVLRQALSRGWVKELGRESGGWQKGKVIRWGITPEGISRLAEYDVARSTPSVRKQRQAQAAANAAAKADREPLLAYWKEAAPALTSPEVKHALALKLREDGCTLQEIADVFGTSREWIRQVLAQGTWRATARPRVKEGQPDGRPLSDRGSSAAARGAA